MIKLIYLYTLLGLVTFALMGSGCSSKKEVTFASPKSLPSWYTNPPKTDNQILYEVGEGINKEDAINKALNFMASTLSVTIASEYTSHDSVRTGSVNSYQQDVDNTIKANVQATRISHYQIVESTEHSFRRYLVLIKSDKKQLFESMKKELNEKIALLKNQESSIKNKNVIEQLRFYKQADDDFASIVHSLNVMHVLNSDFDSSPYLEATNHYKNSYNDLRAKITFGFQSNGQGKNLIAPIKAGLSGKKLLVEERADHYHLVIAIDAKIEEAESMGFHLARSAISITTKNKAQTAIGSNKLNIVGQSTQGFAIAKENVAIQLQQLIDEQGIENILGLNF